MLNLCARLLKTLERKCTFLLNGIFVLSSKEIDSSERKSIIKRAKIPLTSGASSRNIQRNLFLRRNHAPTITGIITPTIVFPSKRNSPEKNRTEKEK